MAGALVPALALASWLAGASAQPAPASVRVLYDRSPVWEHPDVTGPRLATVDRGTVLALDTRQGDWYAVFLPAASLDTVSRRGFMLASAVEVAGSATPSASAGALRQIGGPPPPFDRTPVFDGPEATSLPRQGVFVGIGYALSRHDASGDFDGGHYVYRQGFVSIIPQLAQGSGLDLAVGYRRTRSSIELRYRRTRHDAAWAGLPGSAVSHTLDTSWRVFLLPGDRVQPYVAFEVGMPWLQVEDGLATSAGGSPRDGGLLGVGGGVGAGMTVFVHPRVGLSIGGGYRYDVYLSTRSDDGSWIEIDSPAVGRGLRFSGGLTFTF